MPFKERFEVSGTLTTESPLHIGCGQTVTHPNLRFEQGEGPEQQVEIGAVARDHAGRPYIPGSTLKGRLREILRQHVTKGMLDLLFGSKEQSEDNAKAGSVEFWDSMYKHGPSQPVAETVPYWHPEKLTGVASAVTISRKTRTAAHQKLMHREYVPASVSFAVEIKGQGLTEESIAVLLVGLEQLSVTGLGADTGDGQGRLRWRLNQIRRLRQSDLTNWKSQSEPSSGYSALKPISKDELRAIEDHCVKHRGFRSATGKPSVLLPLELRFTGSFLVNDKYQVNQRREEKPSPSFVPLLGCDGQVVLRARSIRGALRSQAERILRTLSLDAIQHQGDEPACAAIYSMKDKAKLCLLCQLFGAPGLRAPLAITDFTPTVGGSGRSMRQEFLAIDRFTGGGADGLKFNGESVYQPTLSGTLSVSQEEPWMLGFLCLLLRDLAEGDVPMGFGVSKGYGDCRAHFDWQRLGRAEELKAWVGAFRKKVAESTGKLAASTMQVKESSHAVP